MSLDASPQGSATGANLQLGGLRTPPMLFAGAENEKDASAGTFLILSACKQVASA